MKDSRTIPIHYVISVYQGRHVRMFVDELEALPGASLVPCILHCSADTFQPPSAHRSGRRAGTATATDTHETEQKIRQLCTQVSGLKTRGLLELIPAGYAGAPHPVLALEEARLEAEWALSNPWKSGFVDRFGGSYPRLLPFWADPSRGDLNLAILGMYSSIGLGTMPLAGYGDCLMLQTSSGLEFVPVHQLPNLRSLGSFGSSMLALARIRKLAAGYPASPAGKPGLVVHLPWVPGTGSLANLFKFARTLQKQGFTPDTNLGTLPVSVLKSMPSLPLDPASLSPWGPGLPVTGADARQRLIKLSEVRQSRSSIADRVRSQLLHGRPHVQDHPDYPQAYPALADELALPHEAGPVEFTGTMPKTMQRGLISAMQGSATMMADDFSIRFHEGMAQAFCKGDEEIRFAPILDRVLQSRTRFFGLEQEGAIAFESDRVRGLRHSLGLHPEGASLPGIWRIDYVLSDRTPCLLLDVFIRYPWIARDCLLPRFCPLGFELVPGLKADGEGLSVTWTNPDSTESHALFAIPARRHSNRLYCPGTAWTIEWTTPQGNRRGFAMQRMPGETRHPAPMTLEWSMKDKTPVLSIMPEGVWDHIHCRELRGLHHHLSLAIQPLFGDAQAPLDPMVERDFEKFFLFRDSGEVKAGASAT